MTAVSPALVAGIIVALSFWGVMGSLAVRAWRQRKPLSPTPSESEVSQ